MTNTDELSRLARAITEAEDALKETNHRDNLAQLAKIDADAERRPFLVSEIETAENALKDARTALAAYAEKLRPASVKVPDQQFGMSQFGPQLGVSGTNSPYTNGQGQED